MINKFIVLFTILLFSTIPASAWGPHTHTLITDNLFAEQSSEIIRTCTPYKDAFLAGSEIPDITVVYYYSEGGKNYRLTHNWNFQQEVMNQARSPDEVCFAYGIAQHLITDGIIHEGLIPDRITITYLPNWILHPLLEKKYDSMIVKMHPELKSKTPNMLNAMFGSKGDRYFIMIEKAIGDNPAINVRSDTLKLSYALGSFYETAYKPTGDAWMFQLYPFIDSLTNSIEPYIPTDNLGNVQYWVTKSTEQTTNVFNNWGTRFNISPHGFDKLNEADKKIGIGIYLILLIFILVIPVFITYQQKQFLWLLLSPLIIVIMTSIIYILI